ncbi:MAG: UDP-galactopyranose mutase [Caulobacteraceae bacterium]
MHDLLPRSYAPKNAFSVQPAALVDQGSETLICFSHLRWDFVFQRPQHLMTRFAATRRVIYWEEPVSAPLDKAPSLELKGCPKSGVVVATPHLPETVGGEARARVLTELLDGLIAAEKIVRPIRWYYTPMMLGFSRHLEASAVVYDCMDELSHFKFAPPELRALERELMAEADVVFTGGFSLYEAKKDQHRNIHPFPSSVDRPHFAQARGLDPAQDPEDQGALPRPRLGFYGVVDERMDLDLLAHLAYARPDWTLCIVGPVVKIDPADLPMRPNIKYLGGKAYADLPAYLSGWGVALMPFAINDSTKFISPTKTPEYLAGGRPVVSTPITDVIRHYGELEAVKVARTPDEFVAQCEAALALAQDPQGPWLAEVDKALAELSWSQTFSRMSALIDQAILRKQDEAEERLWAVSAPAIRPSGRAKPYDYLIVGAGFAGSILAERLAAGSRKKVLVIDKRPHIAGNAFDHKDAAGVLMHKYGPHIFHTNSQEIVSYLSRFTRWRPYEHRVLACLAGVHVPMPINRTTVNTLYGLNLQTDEEVEAFFASRAEPVETIKTSEDVVVSKIGRELYERFFRGYTRKQWGLDPSELDKSVTSRVPTRTNTDDRYFTDSFQAMPADGYTRMFENILDHENIEVMTGVDFEDVRNEVVYDQLIYTGPVDEYFDHRYGALPYRSLEFRHETLDQAWFQPTGTVNFPAEDVPYTRISEYKHMTGQAHAKTTVTYEYPRADGDPYYPVPRPENQALYKKYEALALQEPDVHFVGRLATYRYYNMDQVAGQALATYRKIVEREGRAAASTDAGARRAVAS